MIYSNHAIHVLASRTAVKVMQASRGSPSISTVRASHSPPSQPCLLPVSHAVSGSWSTSGALSATASSRARPSTVNSSRRLAMASDSFWPQIAHPHRLALGARNLVGFLHHHVGGDADQRLDTVRDIACNGLERF